MNSEERDLISRFVERVGGAQTAPGAQGGQVALPPIDPEADRFIEENFQKYPAARYRITQLAVVQEAALAQAQNRIRELEFQLQQARSQAAQPQQSASGGGFLGGLFGGGRQAQQQPQQPANNYPQGWGPQAAQRPPQQGGYAPPPGAQPGMFPRSGSGFLGSALSTAAGVAGGMMAANALEGLFSGHHDAAGSAGSVGSGVGSDAVGNDVSSDPFGGAGTQAPGFSDSDFPQQDDSSFGGDDGGDFGGGGFDDF
ncbi:DUF2076 domain-containing protein [Acetobacteraceae bacterium ESL0709]|nr:DUF2076 domain-containing protein [Acetobacteraceae bacterium ESL0697]MDF7677672.1 DUF2076 domain-containing protein [Acetobacteraceae bacterium ESL0709]